MAATAVITGHYYAQAPRRHLTTFHGWTLQCRSHFPVFTAVPVDTDLVEPMPLLFGAIDLVGAVWTATALRQEAL